ncbi:hypothetical protein CYMTET_3976 [Cymbomonas tetramitiformis]|uniref:Uncharacterized protein n=1 Tax=Cymbomonas tetramitiformis TaxID=36881 RepID=A0AAE0H2J0_9CHLO|nr:hypothetical protein CYMTET_3976 [Cymbomonas tetramitiformis]
MGGSGKTHKQKVNAGEEYIRVDPRNIRFTHSKIRPYFSDARRVEDTLDEIKDGKLNPDELRNITVIQQETYYVSMNNRRLWVLKQCREQGLLRDDMVPVRVQPPPDTKRLRGRFELHKCSETAKFMREPPPKTTRSEKEPLNEPGASSEKESPPASDAEPSDLSVVVEDASLDTEKVVCEENEVAESAAMLAASSLEKPTGEENENLRKREKSSRRRRVKASAEADACVSEQDAQDACEDSWSAAKNLKGKGNRGKRKGKKADEDSW